MSPQQVATAVKSLKSKNCEGHDNIPQRILIDGIDHLKNPLSILFSKIYNQRNIPEQWLIAKLTPIHKKGPQNKIDNYRPISNLCSASKIFEKLILKRIQNLEILNKINITGVNQHGLKILICGLSIEQFKVDKNLLPKETPVTENGLIYMFGLQENGYKAIVL